MSIKQVTVFGGSGFIGRAIVRALAQEGLLVRAGQRGFAVRRFSASESFEALHLRALLEGYAARRLAERGASAALLQALRDCLAQGDALFPARSFAETDEAGYADMNARFHSLVVDGAQMPLLASFTARCNLVPFTGPDRIAFSAVGRRAVFDRLFYAHRQHHGIVEAIAAGQGDRAEALFREHAIGQEQSMSLGPLAEAAGAPTARR